MCTAKKSSPTPSRASWLSSLPRAAPRRCLRLAVDRVRPRRRTPASNRASRSRVHDLLVQPDPQEPADDRVPRDVEARERPLGAPLDLRRVGELEDLARRCSSPGRAAFQSYRAGSSGSPISARSRSGSAGRVYRSSSVGTLMPWVRHRRAPADDAKSAPTPVAMRRDAYASRPMHVRAVLLRARRRARRASPRAALRSCGAADTVGDTSPPAAAATSCPLGSTTARPGATRSTSPTHDARRRRRAASSVARRPTDRSSSACCPTARGRRTARSRSRPASASTCRPATRRARPRYPVLYLLHGGGGDAGDAVAQGQLREVMDGLIAARPGRGRDRRDARRRRRAVVRQHRRHDPERDVRDRLRRPVRRPPLPHDRRPAPAARSPASRTAGSARCSSPPSTPTCSCAAGGMSSNLDWLGARRLGPRRTAPYYRANHPLDLVDRLAHTDVILDIASRCTSPDPADAARPRASIRRSWPPTARSSPLLRASPGGPARATTTRMTARTSGASWIR